MKKLGITVSIVVAIFTLMYAEYRYIMCNQCPYRGEGGTIYIEMFGRVDEYYAEPLNEVTTRIVDGVYDTSGMVLTTDGNIWAYTQDDITENTSVYALIDDNGTPNYIYDDEVYGVVSK